MEGRETGAGRGGEGGGDHLFFLLARLGPVMSSTSPSDMGHSLELTSVIGKEGTHLGLGGGSSVRVLGKSGSLAQRRMLKTPLAKLEAADHAR